MKWTLHRLQNVGNLCLKSMYIDILNLLGHDVDLQQTIVRKVESFLGSFAYKGNCHNDQTP